MKLMPISSLWRRVLARYCLIFVLCTLLISPVLAGQPDNYIPSLNATVEGLFFYESGEGFPAPKDRVYNTVFHKSKTRYINWEIRLKFPKPGRKIEFPIHYKYYNSQGKTLTEFDIDSYANANWDNSNHTGGFKTTWVPDTYRVDIFIAEDRIASGTFQVVSGSVKSTPSKKPSKTRISTPDDLGEL